MKNLKTLETRLADALTERKIKFTKGQLDFVLNSTHALTDGKTFRQLFFITPLHFEFMIENFLDFRNHSKYESDYNYL